MQDDYNSTTLLVGIGIALAIVLVAVIAINLPEMLNIVSKEGLLSE